MAQPLPFGVYPPPITQTANAVRWVRRVMVLPVLNLAVHLIPLSAVALLDWDVSAVSRHVGHDPFASAAQICAQVEFGLVTAVFLSACLIGALLVATREALTFARHGLTDATLRPLSYILFLGPAAAVAWLLFGLLPQGPAALDGLRGQGMPFAVWMVLCTLFTAASLGILLGDLLDPGKLQLRLDHSRRNRKG